MRTILAKKEHIHPAATILHASHFETLHEAKTWLREKIKNKEFFVVVDGKEVLGLLLYERDYSHYANYISDIVVAKKHRRKGVAHALLEKYIAVSKKETPKKQRYALSSTTGTNKISIKMHLSFGFKELGRVEKLHYGKEEVFFGYRLY